MSFPTQARAEMVGATNTTEMVQEYPQDDPVQFEAPSDLPSGYVLEAEVNGKIYHAVVPPGGAREGDVLNAELKCEERVSSLPPSQPPTTVGTMNLETTTPAPPQEVSFQAPSDLPEGYNLEVEVDGQILQVVVPPGGVRQGDTLSVSVPNKSGAVKSLQEPPPQQQQQQQQVSFQAPSDLPEGYNLEVEMDGQILQVVVPPGGVRQGDTLTVPVAGEQTRAPLPQEPPAEQYVADPENPDGYQLTIHRKQKAHQGCHTWKLEANGQEVGSLANGSSLVVSGTVGDKLEVSMGKGCKTKANTFEMVIRRPGKLNLKLKQAGDLTFWVLITVCMISMIATAAGLILGLIPLLLGLACGSPAIYKYSKAGWREIAPCEVGNEDLKRGSIEHITTRGCCG